MPIKKEDIQWDIDPKDVQWDNRISKTTGVARNIGEGATLGFLDELALGAGATLGYLTKGKNPFDLYKEMREQYNKEQSQFQEENPALAIGSTVAGGLLTAPLTGLNAAKTAYTSKSLMPLVKQGATLGGISGVGFAPTIEDIPLSATLGTVSGAATPVALQGLMRGTQGLYEGGKWLAGAPGRLLQNTDDAARISAANQVQKAFQRDSLLVDDAMKQAGKLGQEAVLADVGGENVRKLAQNVASLPGKTAQLAEKTLQSRMDRSVPRILSALKKSIGKDGTVYRTTKALMENRSKEAGPLYKNAMSQSVDQDSVNPVILELTNTVESAKGTKLGAQLKFVLNSLLTRDGPKTSIRDLHWAKMDIDDRIGAAFRAGNKILASELLKVKNSLLGVMDNVEDYAKARKIYSDDSSVISSIDRGRKILTTAPDEMADFISGLSKADMDGYLIGAQEAIANAIKKTPEGGNSARRVASYAVREKLKQAFPSEDALNQFMKALDIEDTFAQLRNVTIRGSQTQQRVSTESVLAASAVTDAAQGRFISVVMGKIAQFMNNYKHIPEPVRDEIGKMLLSDFSKSGKVSQKLLSKLAKQQIKKDQLSELIYSINSELSPGLIAGEQKAIN